MSLCQIRALQRVRGDLTNCLLCVDPKEVLGTMPLHATGIVPAEVLRGLAGYRDEWRSVGRCDAEDVEAPRERDIVPFVPVASVSEPRRIERRDVLAILPNLELP